MLLLEVMQGLAAGRIFELPGEVATIGRAPSNDVVLEDMHVSGEHARVVVDGTRFVLNDLRSTNGTTLVRRGERWKLTGEVSACDLESGDLIELGSGDGVTSLRVRIADEARAAHILSMRRLDEMAPAQAAIERDPSSLEKLYAAEKRIVAATDLDRVLIEVADAALFLVPTATHVTLVLRDDDQGTDKTAAAFVPVMTRVRTANGGSGPPAGPVPITRSIYRRVVEERAAVLGADAPERGRRHRFDHGSVHPEHHRPSRSGRARTSSACCKPITAAMGNPERGFPKPLQSRPMTYCTVKPVP